METQKTQKAKFWLGLAALSFFSLFISLVGCDSNEIKEDKVVIAQPDPNKESGIEYYFPDSGGVKTQIILKGYNLGTDTSLLKVTVNGKNARIVSVKNDFVYAVVPARADTGFVQLHINRDGQMKNFTFDNLFRYKFVRNVTTYAGKDNVKERVDGSLADSRIRRPWFLLRDVDNTLFFLEEGRGSNKDGALRRVIEGMVETLYENNSGIMRAPISMAFNPAQDTLYIAQWSYKGNSDGAQRTTSAIVYSTRDGGFVNMKTFVETTDDFACTAVAAHPKTGQVFFNSQEDGYIYKYTGGGANNKGYERLFRINNATDTNLRMRFSNDGKTLYYVVRNRHCIWKSNYNESTRTLSEPEIWVGAWDESGYTNGIGGIARFDNPSAPTFDLDNNMYVPEVENHIIRKITPDGVVSLHSGLPKQSGYKDGGPEFARFRNPNAVEILDDGAVYVADFDTYTIRRVMVE